jgi:RimJ/RimL family protein N-acetyltransferase
MQSLRTPRLTLEPQTADHAVPMFELLCDPALYEFEGAPPASVEWLRARFLRLESRRSPDGSQAWVNWVLRLRSSGGLVGYVQATVHADATADIAYVLASRHWGRGLACEAVVAMLQELQTRHQVTQFSAVLKQANHRSMRLLQRLGFAPAPAQAKAARELEADELLMHRPGTAPQA